MLVMALYNVVDRVFIGQFCGSIGLAALTITFPIMNLATAVGVLVGVGASAGVSIKLGAKCVHDAEKILGNALTLTIINAIIYMALFVWYLDPMLVLFGADEVTLPLAREYMLALMPGLLLTNLAFSLNNVMRSTGYPQRAMYTMIIGAVTNVVLDPIFIIVFDWGIAGAAWATVIAMAVSAVFVLWHFFRPDVNVRFRRGTFTLRSKVVWSIVSIGCAPAIVNAASCAINALVNQKLLTYGDVFDLSAAGIMITYTSIIVTIVLGICQGMQPIIGYNYGAKQLHRLSRTYWLAVGVASIITASGSLFGLSFPRTIASLFNSDAALSDATARALHLCLVAFSVVGFQVISTTLFQSLGKAEKSIIVSLLRQVIFLIPLLIFLPSWWGLNGVWMSFPISDLLATIVTGAMVWYQLRQLRNNKV